MFLALQRHVFLMSPLFLHGFSFRGAWLSVQEDRTSEQNERRKGNILVREAYFFREERQLLKRETDIYLMRGNVYL